MAKVSNEELATQESVSKFLIKSDAESALTDEVFADTGDYTERGVEFIGTASEEVKNYLNRSLIVSEHNPLLASSDWKEVERTPDTDYPRQLRLNRVEEWPVLSVTEDVKIHGDRRVFAKDDSFDTIEYFAGYRRGDQTLSDFGSNIQSEFGSESEVPVIPEVITDVVKRIAVHKALRNMKGLLGIKRIEQRFGQFSGTVQTEDAKETYENKQLNRITAHRFLT